MYLLLSNWRKKVSPFRWKMTADKSVKLEEKSISFLLENDSRQKGQIGGKKYFLFVGELQQTVHEMAMLLLV